MVNLKQRQSLIPSSGRQESLMPKRSAVLAGVFVIAAALWWSAALADQQVVLQFSTGALPSFEVE
ncbi:MAG: hypothetical protein ACT6S0_00360 [Roseateles sp.]|uniref:Uncharacterized protein n=1 Tax=Roseateles asaccharophilus TaxID=582607 RepID=A0ABU2AG49_9BURK|nr:hypothetical protein [Roseateles asaccharophilus]MDR7336184.1 hypothetical protein [Roseateles asaccharophilus]